MAEKTPNDKFREARRRTASPTNPDVCLSRQQLAELANSWIWEHRHEKFDLDASYIGKLEQGIIRWPRALPREAFREIFHVSKDSELGFFDARAHSLSAAVKLSDVDAVKRRQLFETAEFGVGALILEEPTGAFLEIRSSIPDRVGSSDIEQIRGATQVFNSWGRVYGGGVARETVMGQLRWSAGLLKATCPERLRPELYSAVGDLAQTAALMAYDSGAHQGAHRIYHFALYCAHQVKDWPLRASVLDGMAHQEIRTGQPDNGLSLADQALVRADRLTATERAMLHGTRALALARMRRLQETLTAVGAADEYFAHSSPANDPPFMAFYTDAWHAQYIGLPLFDLVILGRDPGEATTRLTAAAAGHPEDHTRERGICLTRLASLTMVTGDPLQAAALGHEALNIADGIRSRRAAEDLRELFRYATPNQDLEEVAHLRHRITTLVCTENS